MATRLSHRTHTGPPSSDGSATQSPAAGTQARLVQAADGQRDHRSVSVPGEHPDAEPGGGHRFSAHGPTEGPEAAGRPADPRAPGLRRLPAVSGRLQLDPRPTAAGGPEWTWTRSKRLALSVRVKDPISITTFVSNTAIKPEVISSCKCWMKRVLFYFHVSFVLTSEFCQHYSWRMFPLFNQSLFKYLLFGLFLHCLF